MEEKKKSNVIKIALGIIAVVLIIVVVVISINQIKKTEKEKKIEEARKELNEAISKISDTKNDSINSTISNSQTSSIKDNTKKQYAEVSVGQTITIEDYLEYSFIETNFTNKLEPSNPKSYYHYYEAKSSENILLTVKTKIKNLQAEEFEGKQLPKATIIYDGKYKYNCTIIVEEDDGSDLDGYDWYMNIEPLKSKTFYYYAELPQEAKEDGKSLTLRIELKNNSYELKIR